jgi:hypothetical protein
MSPKTRFQVMLEPDQLAAMRRIEEETGAPIGEQIRRAVNEWLKARGDKTERKRASTRKRS